MACGDQNPGVLVGHGRAKIFRLKTAIARALADLQNQGDAACAGQMCAGGNCEWALETVQITTEIDQETNSIEATATGTGSCQCL